MAVEGSRAGGGLFVETRAERVHGAKARVGHTPETALAAAGERQRTVAAAYGAEGLEETVGGGGAGHVVAHAGTREPEADGDVAGGEVVQDARNEEGTQAALERAGNAYRFEADRSVLEWSTSLMFPMPVDTNTPYGEAKGNRVPSRP